MNLKSFAIRSLIALIFGPLIIMTALHGRFFWFALISLIAILSVYEFFELSEKRNVHAQYYIGVIAPIVILFMLYHFYDYLIFPIILIISLIVFFSELYRKKGSPVLNISVTLFGILFYSLSLGSLILIREMAGRYGLVYGPPGGWIVMMVLVIWVCDTMAYIVGSKFGRHKLIERISPNKTIEGTVTGFIFALISAYICHVWFIEGLRLVDSLVIGALAGSIGQYGDLFESMFKRDVGVKDSSELIPEHGGILDRFDSITITAPAMYIYLEFFTF